MPIDPRSHARAAVLAGAMMLEPSPYDFLQARVSPIRRTVTNARPPLDLTALVFRYRQAEGKLEAVRPRHGRVCGAHRREMSTTSPPRSGS